MRIHRFLGGSLVAAAILAGCSDTSRPTGPGSESELARTSQSCTILDNPATQTRTVSAGCANHEVTVPEGWTLNVIGEPAPGQPLYEFSPTFTPFPNPTPDYTVPTFLIDISDIADFTTLTSVSSSPGDPPQTVTFDVTMEKRSVPGSWATWGAPPFTEGAFPHVLWTQGATTLTMTLSEPSEIFGFELGPNLFALQTFTADFYSGAALVGSITREFDGGARLFAAQAAPGQTFDRVVVRGDFAIARIRWKEGPSPFIDVEIEDVYSGDPRQDPGVISIDDEWVYVEILDPLQYRPNRLGSIPFQSPDQVRIGESFETGTPAESYVLVDIGGDPAELDIRLRWSLQQLIDDGNLTCDTGEIDVWGRDGDDNYHGSHPVEVIDCPTGDICFDNGGFITHPNGGTGVIAGEHVSMAESIGGVSTAGSNALLSGAGPHFRIADDFTVGPAGCTVTQVITHGYQTGAATPLWTSANLNIREGSVTGPIVATATTTTWVFSGVYRTFNGILNNADRPVHEIIFSFNNVPLGPGTYWVDWQVVGAASGWANYRMEPNPANPGNPITVFENGQQMFNVAGAWQPLLQPPGAEIPFIVAGDAGGMGLGVYRPARHDPVAGRPPVLPPDYSLWPTDRSQ